MAVAHSILTLDEGFPLFWAAFDLLMTVVPLKVALGLEKIDFWPLKKILKLHLGYTCLIIFLKHPKIKFVPS